MRWYCHHRPRAVAPNHVLCNPNRESLSGQRVRHVHTGRHARFRLGHGAIQIRFGAGGRDIFGHGRIRLGGGYSQGMLWRHHDVSSPHERVSASGEDKHRRVAPPAGILAPAGLLARQQREGNLRPLGPADPRPLHGHGSLRPVEPCQLLGQPVPQSGDLEHPLA
eukprot:scaffold12784_cov90-Isochrysis_galbana.AAC.1